MLLVLQGDDQARPGWVSASRVRCNDRSLPYPEEGRREIDIDQLGPGMHEVQLQAGYVEAVAVPHCAQNEDLENDARKEAK